MIVSFRDEGLRAFFVEDRQSRHIPPDIETRLFRKLQMIDDAMTDQDLRVPPQQSFREIAGQSGWLAFRARQQSVAAGVPMERQSRRGRRRLSRRPQLQVTTC
jgi:proteic killer suppression protein